MGPCRGRPSRLLGMQRGQSRFFIPPPPDETLTNIANKTNYGQYFDHHVKLQDHDYVVHTYCTDCKRGFDNWDELWDHVLELHVEEVHHACRESEEVSHAFHPPTTRRDLNKRRKQNGLRTVFRRLCRAPRTRPRHAHILHRLQTGLQEREQPPAPYEFQAPPTSHIPLSRPWL